MRNISFAKGTTMALAALTSITVKKDSSTASLSLIRNNDGSIEFTPSGGTKRVIQSVSNDGAKTLFDPF